MIASSGSADAQPRPHTLTMQRSYAWLAFVLVGFVLYLSLIPFEFRHVPVAVAWMEFSSALGGLPHRVSRSDVLANALILIPTSFALMGALLAGRPAAAGRAAAATAAVLVTCVALSLTAEFLEIFAAGRITSLADVIAQTLGAIGGVLVWAVAGPALTRWLRAAAMTEDRLSRVLTGYAAAWIFVNLAPFDITLDLGDLAERFRSGRIVLVPFAGELSGARLIWDAVAATISAIPLGPFGLVRGMAAGSQRTAGRAFIVAAALLIVVEAAQVFIHSHTADVTDVLFGCAGVAVGVLWGRHELSRRARHVVPADPLSPLGLLLLAGWVLVVVGYHWLPYDFIVDSESIKAKLARMSLVPFSGYHGSYLSALNDVLTKTALAMPFGAIATFAWRPSGVGSIAYAAVVLTAAALCFGLAELGQFFLPSRVPDPTDVLLGIGGSYVGILIGSWLAARPR
jgi:VanZ family protein